MSPTAISSIDQTPRPSVRRSGRAVHPANRSPDDLPDEEPLGALSFRALRAIATGFARVQPPVPLGEDDPSTPRSERLLATAYYDDVWLMARRVRSRAP